MRSPDTVFLVGVLSEAAEMGLDKMPEVVVGSGRGCCWIRSRNQVHIPSIDHGALPHEVMHAVIDETRWISAGTLVKEMLCELARYVWGGDTEWRRRFPDPRQDVYGKAQRMAADIVRQGVDSPEEFRRFWQEMNPTKPPHENRTSNP